jgi:orotidine-5'-phosphate decarboxylase
MTRDTLVSAIFEKKTFLCVGLDTERGKIPPHLLRHDDPVFEFNRQIIDATRDLCVAYKPNLAFYEALGPEGWRTLQRTVQHIGPDHFTIADAKRGDIGNTSQMYAEAFFQQLGFDSVTVAPYMGADSVQPFLGFEGKWAILLALTSNAGSEDFQRLELQTSNLELHLASGETNSKLQTPTPLWEQVLALAQTWATPENLMFVVGATHPEAFARVRQIAPRHFLLVPGVGAQGGDLRAICQHGFTPDCGLLVNASRSILYASSGEDFAEKARAEALRMQQEMQAILEWRMENGEWRMENGELRMEN